MKASTYCSILVKTLKEPLEASVKTSPIKVNKLAEVVASKHPQMAVGLVNPAYVQTPVKMAQTLALAVSGKANKLSEDSPKMA